MGTTSRSFIIYTFTTAHPSTISFIIPRLSSALQAVSSGGQRTQDLETALLGGGLPLAPRKISTFALPTSPPPITTGRHQLSLCEYALDPRTGERTLRPLLRSGPFFGITSDGASAFEGGRVVFQQCRTCSSSESSQV